MSTSKWWGYRVYRAFHTIPYEPVLNLKKKSIFFLEERVHPILLGHSISNGRLINE